MEGKESAVTPKMREKGKALADAWIAEYTAQRETRMAEFREKWAAILREMHAEIGLEFVDKILKGENP